MRLGAGERVHGSVRVRCLRARVRVACARARAGACVRGCMRVRPRARACVRACAWVRAHGCERVRACASPTLTLSSNDRCRLTSLSLSTPLEPRTYANATLSISMKGTSAGERTDAGGSSCCMHASHDACSAGTAAVAADKAVFGQKQTAAHVPTAASAGESTRSSAVVCRQSFASTSTRRS
eukprot:6182141-Pleurochrysis_carterae.AAC.3